MAKKKAAASKKAAPKTAKPRKAGDNKSQAIRTYLKANRGEGPTAVATALGKQGVKVTAAYVSTIKLLDKRKKKGSAKKAGKKSGAKAAGRSQARKDTVSMSTLLEAKRLAAQMGGVDKAKTALDALSKLVN